MSEEAREAAVPTETVIAPQIRFLWQTGEITDRFLKEYAEVFGREFSYGYDGIILKQPRWLAAGWWRVSSDGKLCEICFSDGDGLSAALTFLKEKIAVSGERLTVPVGKWEAAKA